MRAGAAITLERRRSDRAAVRSRGGNWGEIFMAERAAV
jgi:hypothetical protein